MIFNRSRGFNLIHATLRIAVALAVYWIWYAVFFYGFIHTAPASTERYVVYCLLVAVSLSIEFVWSALDRIDLIHLGVIKSCRHALRQLAAVFGVLLLFLVAAKDQAISRAFLFSYGALLFLSLYLANYHLPAVLARVIFGGRRRQRVLLCLTDGQLDPRLFAWLERRRRYGIEPIGVVKGAGPADVASRLRVPVLGTCADLEPILDRHPVEQVVFSGIPHDCADLVQLTRVCEERGVRLLILNDIKARLDRTLNFVEHEGLDFIALREEPLESPVNRALKRATDVLLALAAGVVLLPPAALLVWLLHRFQSPGPLLFRQRRVGLDGHPFTLYKFRTMHTDNGDETRQATPSDPRVFALGRWLRRFSVDELPQFVNVLRGDMSVVGPRPHMIEHDEQFARVFGPYRVRKLIKPGITGLAQVRGFRGEARTDADIVNRAQSDLYYLENWSPTLDFIIIARTAWQVVFPPRSAC